MKLVIYTQYAENYGDEDKPYWKMKGGDTYVVENLTQSQVTKIQEQGVPTLKALIEYKNPMSEEYIIGFNVVPDSTSICEEWETPTKLSWLNSRWAALKVEENNELSCWNPKIERRIQTWDLMMQGQRENYNCVFVMRNGSVVKESDSMEAV